MKITLTWLNYSKYFSNFMKSQRTRIGSSMVKEYLDKKCSSWFLLKTM